MSMYSGTGWKEEDQENHHLRGKPQKLYFLVEVNPLIPCYFFKKAIKMLLAFVGLISIRPNTNSKNIMLACHYSADRALWAANTEISMTASSNTLLNQRLIVKRETGL